MEENAVLLGFKEKKSCPFGQLNLVLSSAGELRIMLEHDS